MNTGNQITHDPDFDHLVESILAAMNQVGKDDHYLLAATTCRIYRESSRQMDHKKNSDE